MAIADVLAGVVQKVFGRFWAYKSWQFQWTGYTNVRNLIGLFDACCDVLENPRFAPTEGKTFCNLALDYISVKAFGNHDFNDKTADQILEFVAQSEDYTEIAINQAQNLANQGSFVFAAASSKMLGQEHGHVCVIRPGVPKESGKWGMVPAIVNVGSELFIARAKKGPLTGMPAGLNEAFVPLPRLFVWRPSLGSDLD